MGALQDFQARFGGGVGRSSGNPLSDFESRFSVAKLDSARSQRAGGLDNLSFKQLGSLGYRPSDLGQEYVSKEMSKSFGGANKTFANLYNKLGEKDRSRLLEELSKIPGNPLSDSLIQQAKYAPKASFKANLDENLRDFGRASTGTKLLGVLAPLPVAGAMLGGDKLISKPVKSFSETYNQNLLGGLGRSAINLGAGLAEVGSLGYADTSGKKRLQDMLFPEQGTKKSLSSTKVEDLDKYGRAGQLAGSGSKAVVEMAGIGKIGNLARGLAGASKAVQGLSQGGKIARVGSKAVPLLADSLASSTAQTMSTGGDIKRGVTEGLAYDAAFNIFTGGLGKIAKNLKVPDEMTNLIKQQKSIDDIAKLIDNTNNLPPKVKQKLLDRVDESINQARVYADDFNPKYMPTKHIAENYPDGSPKRAIYTAMSDNAVEQGDKLNAGINAYRKANPSATREEASTAVFEVLDDINQRSVGTVRGGLKNTTPATISGSTTKGVVAKVRNIFNPIANLADDAKASFTKSANAKFAARTERTTVVNKLRQAAKESKTKLDMDLVYKMENGTAPDTDFTRQFRAEADALRQEAIDSGLDIGYRDNYIPHIWKQSAEEVDQIAKKFGMKPRAVGERIIPTYEEGIKLGLKSKYKDPAEMLGDYVNNIKSARANVELVTDLNKQGLLIDGRPPQGFMSITAEGFPRAADGSQLSAPKEIAEVINNIYGSPTSIIDKALGKTAKFNSIWQDIALAGGIPKTPANFFTFAQMVKEMTTGVGNIATGRLSQGINQMTSPIAAFARAFSKSSTAKYEIANKDFLEQLAKNGAPLSFSTSAGKWGSLFNDPTFGRFMPNMQLGTAKSTYKALSKKVGDEEAMKQTAQIMKKMYGITDQLSTGRSQAVQDLIGSVGFAPKYRESIINVLGNTVRAVADPRTWKNQAYSLNRRLAVGMGVTLLAYDQMNRQTMGHGLLENPEGKELQLAIPYGTDEEGNKKVVYIPFMPSFMTIPRAAVGAAQSLAKGDLAGVGSEAGKMLSMPLQVGSQLASNRDYFGRPIVIDDKAAKETGQDVDSGWDMLKKRGLYLTGQSSPAAVRAGLDYAQKKPLEQVIAQGLEAPVRFGKVYEGKDKTRSASPGQISGSFYEKYSMLKAQSDKKESSINKDIYGGTGNPKETASQFNSRVEKELAEFFKRYGSTLTDKDREMYESMRDRLKIDVRDKKRGGGMYINKYN